MLLTSAWADTLNGLLSCADGYKGEKPVSFVAQLLLLFLCSEHSIRIPGANCPHRRFHSHVVFLGTHVSHSTDASLDLLQTQILQRNLLALPSDL